ncbi:MAG: hypothetical protein IJM66_11600 [Muribaculaceae bacterium]|nr:hypothetical protein [Muribaculaceae bacterium]MBQ6649477.1 hypothetical protein [Muribaculaceae bacterium]
MSSQNTFSQASRELKLKYQDLKASVDHEFNQRQTKVSINIERLRNERSYYIAKLRLCEDIEESRSRIDELSDDIARYHMEKVELDRARKESINALKRRQNKEIDALELKFAKDVTVLSNSPHTGKEGGEQ